MWSGVTKLEIILMDKKYQTCGEGLGLTHSVSNLMKFNEFSIMLLPICVWHITFKVLRFVLIMYCKISKIISIGLNFLSHISYNQICLSTNQTK